MTMTGRPYRRRRDVTVVSLLLLVLATILGPTPSSAAGAGLVDTDRAARARLPDQCHRRAVHRHRRPGRGARLRRRAQPPLRPTRPSAAGSSAARRSPKPGVADALKDCPEHYPDGSLAVFDYITNGGDGKHDPAGWPTFKDWPAHDSMTHQAELLRLGRAGLARRPAGARQRPRHQRHDLLGLLLQGPQLRRDDRPSASRRS